MVQKMNNLNCKPLVWFKRCHCESPFKENLIVLENSKIDDVRTILVDRKLATNRPFILELPKFWEPCVCLRGISYVKFEVPFLLFLMKSIQKIRIYHEHCSIDWNFGNELDFHRLFGNYFFFFCFSLSSFFFFNYFYHKLESPTILALLIESLSAIDEKKSVRLDIDDSVIKGF